MPNLSPIEVLVVVVLALIVFGPERLPGFARTIGRTLSEVRRMADEARSEFRMGLDDSVDEDPEGEADADADASAPERPR